MAQSDHEKLTAILRRHSRRLRESQQSIAQAPRRPTPQSAFSPRQPLPQVTTVHFKGGTLYVHKGGKQ